MSSLISYESENCDVLLCSCCANNHKPAFRHWYQSQDYFLIPRELQAICFRSISTFTTSFISFSLQLKQQGKNISGLAAKLSSR